MNAGASLSLSFYGFWLLALLGFPIGGGLARLLVGPAENVVAAALAGLLTGAVIGLAQWLVLRQILSINLGWVAVTAISMGLGLALGVALLGIETTGTTLIARAVITGLFIGVAQWLLLREIVPMSAWWILILAIAWAVSWTITRAVGVDLTQNWSVFGASGALVFQLVTAVALRLLLG